MNTGKNEILEDVLKIATDDITEKLYSLLQGEKVVARIDQNVVYRSIAEDPANIYSLLLVAGYLKTPKKELQMDGAYLCEVSIPNREIAAVYKTEILSYLLQIERLQEPQPIRSRKVFLQMITVSFKRQLVSTWINPSVFMMPGQKDSITVWYWD